MTGRASLIQSKGVMHRAGLTGIAFLLLAGACAGDLLLQSWRRIVSRRVWEGNGRGTIPGMKPPVSASSLTALPESSWSIRNLRPQGAVQSISVRGENGGTGIGISRFQ